MAVLDLESLFSAHLRRATPVVRLGGEQPPYPFAFGLPDPGSFPRQQLVKVTRRVLETRSAEALQYGNFQGVPELREVVAERLQRQEGLELSPEAILITNGSSHAISLVAQALVDPGDTILVEGPTFLGAVRTFEEYGPRVVEIPLDDRGLRTDILETTLRDLQRQGVRPKLIYTLPTFQNPAGVTMALDRRRRLLALADRYGVPILEDDPYGELRFEGRTQPSLLSLDQGGLVLRCGSFSKILGAGLRLGWIAGRQEVVKRLVSLKSDGGTNPFASHVAAEFARQGLLEKHVRKLRAVYRERRDAMRDALDAHCATFASWLVPQGGFFFWLTLHPDVDPSLLRQGALRWGVSYLQGEACYSSSSGHNQLRLAFSFLPAERIREGIALLGEALASAQRVPAAAGARG